MVAEREPLEVVYHETMRHVNVESGTLNRRLRKIKDANLSLLYMSYINPIQPIVEKQLTDYRQLYPTRIYY